MPATAPGWDHFSHQADIGIRGWGASKAMAFTQAAKALTAVVTDLENIKDVRQVTVECAAPNDDFLLFAWINRIIYEMSVNKMLFCHYQLDITDHRLAARLGGEDIDVARHQPAVEIKGATLTELRVSQHDDGMWSAQCVVDV